MIALWMVYSLVLSAGVALAAAILDRAATGSRLQRRWIWSAALALSAGLPAWQIVASRLGGERQKVAPNAKVDDNATPSSPLIGRPQAKLAELLARAESRSLGTVNVALGVTWGVAVVLTLGAYCAATWSLARRRRSWRSAVLDGERVLVAPTTGPAVIGAFHPVIVIPEWSLALPADQRALMLEHERQHMRAKDPVLLHAAGLVTALVPWNLVGWWLVRRLRLAVEMDCDARVLAAGRDARAYGTLLLDVCARRLRSGGLLSPALFERTSSLTRRIIAMHSDRPRFARARFTLGAAAALAIVVVACDMPSPEVVAPDGKNQATKRLYGESQNVVGPHLDAKDLVTTYFPGVARGEGESSILFVVRSSTGTIVLTESQPAGDLVKIANPGGELGAANKVEPRTPKLAEPTRDRVAFATTGTELRMNQVRTPPGAEKGVVLFKVRAATRPGLPSGVGAIAPNDIATIDVSKHAAGTAAPKAVSIVTITLKPGAMVPTTENR